LKYKKKKFRETNVRAETCSIGRSFFNGTYCISSTLYIREKQKKKILLACVIACRTHTEKSHMIYHMRLSYEFLHVIKACYEMRNQLNNRTWYHVSVVWWLYVVIWCDVLNMLKHMIINDVTSDCFRFTTSQMCMAISVSFAICTNLFLKKSNNNKNKQTNKTKQTYKTNYAIS